MTSVDTRLFHVPCARAWTCGRGTRRSPLSAKRSAQQIVRAMLIKASFDVVTFPFAGAEFRQYIFSAYGGESGADGSTESLVGVHLYRRQRSHIFNPILQRSRAPSEMPQVQLCLLSCCPCLLGNPCSASRRDEYSKAMRSFCFLISIVDVRALQLLAFC